MIDSVVDKLDDNKMHYIGKLNIGIIAPSAMKSRNKIFDVKTG
jgi:hypothetical protein